MLGLWGVTTLWCKRQNPSQTKTIPKPYDAKCDYPMVRGERDLSSECRKIGDIIYSGVRVRGSGKRLWTKKGTHFWGRGGSESDGII